MRDRHTICSFFNGLISICCGFINVIELSDGWTTNRQKIVHQDKLSKRIFHAEYIELREVLRDIADERGEINRRKLGWWIRRHAGRNVDGRRFVRASGNRSAEAWQVDVVESVSPVSSVSTLSSGKSVSDTTDNSNANASASRGAQQTN
jgi:hypothetical protein